MKLTKKERSLARLATYHGKLYDESFIEANSGQDGNPIKGSEETVTSTRKTMAKWEKITDSLKEPCKYTLTDEDRCSLCLAIRAATSYQYDWIETCSIRGVVMKGYAADVRRTKAMILGWIKLAGKLDPGFIIRNGPAHEMAKTAKAYTIQEIHAMIKRGERP